MTFKPDFENLNSKQNNPCHSVIREIKKFKHGSRINFSIFTSLMVSLYIMDHTEIIYDLGIPMCIYFIVNILMYKVTIDGKLKLIKQNDLTSFENNIIEMIEECNTIVKYGKSVLSKINKDNVPTNRFNDVYKQYELFNTNVKLLQADIFRESIRTKHFEHKLSLIQFENYYKFIRKIRRCGKISVQLSLMFDCLRRDYPNMFK